MTVIRERITQVAACLAEIDVALFTSFTFNADFFEQNVLPALFGCEPEDKRSVREARVHKGLSSTRVAAFYDASLLRPSRRRFRYAAVPMYLGPDKIFHPKNIIIFGRDAQGERWIYVAAISANLSISGWGQNCEGIADTWIHAKSEQPAKELREFLLWLQNRRRSRSDTLLAAVQAWDGLRSQRGLVDPDGIAPNAKGNLRLYFSSLHRSLWSFLKEQYGPPQSVVAGSPYWGDSSQAAAELRDVHLELIASRCPPRFQSVNLGENTLTQLYPSEASKPKVYAWRGESGRFHHLKVYQIKTERGEFTGLGSCNFTDRGQFWSQYHGNVESMLFDRLAVALPPKVALSERSFPLESESDDPPSVLPAYVSLQYDWLDGTLRWRLEGSAAVLPATLDVPDGGKPVLLTDAESEGSRKGTLCARTFTFTFQSGEVHEGLVEELNLAESTLVYGRALPARDILESWRIASAAEPDPPPEEGTGEAVDENMSPEGQVLIRKQKEEPFDWFLFYRCVRNMRDRLERAAGDRRLLADLILARSDSVLALSDCVLAGSMQPAGKWLVIKECIGLLRAYGEAVPHLKSKLRFLKARHKELKVLVEEDLERTLPARVRAKAADVMAWYDRQVSKEVRQ